MNCNALNAELSGMKPRDIIKSIFKNNDNVALSFSGAEDVVLIDMACKLGFKPSIFTLDTGRLHPETYQYIQTVIDHYKIKIDILMPDAAATQQLTLKKGLFSFYQDGHKECCSIRKVAPLKSHLTNFSAWITGQRRDQSKETRDSLDVAEVDNAFKGSTDQLLKFNPLAHWSSEEVWTYIRSLEIPFNPLHNEGYESIGCLPCTRPTLPHQDPREGRWWWEEANSKECGLHSSLADISSPKP